MAFRKLADHVYELQDAMPDMRGFIEAEDSLMRNFPTSFSREDFALLEAALVRDALSRVDAKIRDGRLSPVTDINRSIRHGGLNLDRYNRNGLEELVRASRSEAASDESARDALDFAHEEAAVFKKGKGKRPWWYWLAVIIITIVLFLL